MNEIYKGQVAYGVHMPVVKSFKYVILGGGVAAGYAAREFVRHGLPKGDLAIVSSDIYAPYERPLLSKEFYKVDDPPRLPSFHTCVADQDEPQTHDWYITHGIDLMLNTHVDVVDVPSHLLTVKDRNMRIRYGKLIVATGCCPVTLTDAGVEGIDPNAHINGIHYLRVHNDALKLYDSMKYFGPVGGKAVVIGPGYIAMEVISGMIGHGLNVTMVYPHDRLLPKQFTPALAAPYEDKYRRMGVSLVRGRVTKVEAEESQVRAVVLESGMRLVCDLVLVAIGAKPNIDMFRGQLNVDDEKRGIVVDAQLRTSDPDIYAVGDVAVFPLKMYDNRMTRVEHVDNARASARHVVAAIFGNTAPYDYLPYFYSREFELNWKFWGDNTRGECFVIGRMHPKLLAVWVDDNRLLGIHVESCGKEAEVLAREAARKQLTVDSKMLSVLRQCQSVDDCLSMLDAALHGLVASAAGV